MHIQPVKTILNATAPAWLNPVWLSIWYGIAITYGSLIPFDFKDNLALIDLLSAWTTPPAWQTDPTSYSSLSLNLTDVDLITNIGLYLPLGILLRIATRKYLVHHLSQIITSTLIASMLSSLIETTQHCLSSRIASLNDIACNTTGAFIGACLGIIINNTMLHATAAFVTFFIIPLSAIHTFFIRLSKTRFKLSIALVLLLIAVTLLLYGLFHSVMHTGNRSHTIILPFVAHQKYSYDVAASLLAQSSIIYLISGLLLASTLHTLRSDKVRVLTIIFIALLSASSHAIYGWLFNNAYDFTELILAAIIISAILTLYQIPILLLYTAWSYNIIHPIQLKQSVQ